MMIVRKDVKNFADESFNFHSQILQNLNVIKYQIYLSTK